MACARRALTSSYYSLITRRFHPSLSHLLPHQYDSDGDRATAPVPSHLHARGFHNGGSSAGFGSWTRERSGLGFALPLGFEPSLRRYSSSSVGSREAELTSNMSSVLADKGPEIATDVLAEKSVELAQAASPVVSEVAAAAADSAFPVAALQHVIDAIHTFTGLNWWVSIALTTLLIRLCTFPIMIHQLKATSKLSVIRPELEVLKEQMQNSSDPQAMQESQRKVKELFKKHGVNPFTPLKGMFIQGPVFISFYLAISNMVEKVPSFKEGGALWFTDLTTADPFYALPVMTAMSFLVTVELNMQAGMESNPMTGNMKKFSRVMAVLTVPFTASFPKAIFCYWITSNLYSLVYGYVLKRPAVKTFLGIPDVTPEPSPAPSSQSSFSFFGGIKQLAPAVSSSPMSSQPSQPLLERRTTSSVISQRIQNLENTAKDRSKPKKNKKRR